MSDAERYQQAARRASTARRYAQAIEHFEGEWGGLLPASSASVVGYLAAYGPKLSANTLRTHLAALAQWHQQRGFPDPTKTAQVRDTLRGIQALHPQPIKQALALQLQVLETSIDRLTDELMSGEPEQRLRAARDQALILLGFWRAFRGDELCRLQAEHVRIDEGEGLQLFLPTSKTDRDNRGRNLTMPALKRLCPVQATQQWLALSGITQGPLFRGIDRWGHLGEQPLHPNSVSRLLRGALMRSGTEAQGYSAHSLRRGFATWASRNQWSSEALMAYVGWRDVQSAARYIEPHAPFAEWLR
ncbi:tyrosine-type recombinase/integrase [Pseudomonas putida]|uniref:site-specific integrase n=1 Tax=Pseudomonas putida TaxID=303 RepID=UPI002270121D|nr:tyrosine-type recombinase/integrase [Pseudomonas putida]WAB99748.1 tyrosine-type recombinase/integrase [Pseudomonas putida]